MQQMSLGFQRGSAAAFEKDIGNWHVSLSIHGGDCNLLVKVENVGCIFFVVHNFDSYLGKCNLDR